MELPLPEFVQIEPVGRGSSPAFMSFESFCRLLEQLPEVAELRLQGMGEPLLHPRFFGMVRLAASRGIQVSTSTRLTSLSDRRAEEFVTSGLRRMQVALDASRHSRVLANVQRVVRAKSRLGSPSPAIELIAVVIRRNLEGLPRLVRLAHNYGVDGMCVQHLAFDFKDSGLPARYRPVRRFVEAESLLNEDPARMERWFGEARAVAAELGMTLELPGRIL